MKNKFRKYEEKIKTKEYFDWIYNFIKLDAVYSDEEALDEKYEKSDNDNMLIISHFCAFIDKLAHEQGVKNMAMDEFEVADYYFKLYDKFYRITTLSGLGSVTYINLAEDRPSKYVRLNGVDIEKSGINA